MNAVKLIAVLLLIAVVEMTSAAWRPSKKCDTDRCDYDCLVGYTKNATDCILQCQAGVGWACITACQRNGYENQYKPCVKECKISCTTTTITPIL